MSKKTPYQRGSWQRKLGKAISSRAMREGVSPALIRANSVAVHKLINASATASSTSPRSMGAYMVVNMSSAYIAAFCSGRYLNCYDRNAQSKSREKVDRALPLPPGCTPETAYFGALELTGTGVRYYGDICLVLKGKVVADDTLVLERNSYDLLRSPFKERVASAKCADSERKNVAFSWGGSWQQHLGTITAIRAISRMSSGDRLWTLGQIAQVLCDDEDYIEVIKKDSFRAGDLLEARTSAADVAHEAQINDRLARGPLPTIEALVWAAQRRDAELALRGAGVTLRVVTTSGRMRG
jgi:hypothetical protein